jgi:hypothetical protein
VTDAGRGGDHHPGAGHLSSPAQVDVGPVVRHGSVEAAQLGEEVGPHQHAGGGDGEDVAHRVVLLLVELAAVDQRRGGAGLVNRQAHAEQAVGPVPVDQLGGHDARVGAQRLLHHEAQGVGLGGHVVVAEHQEGGALDGVEDVVGGGSEARGPAPPVGAAKEGIGQHGGDARPEILSPRTVDDQDRLIGVVLGAHRL